jgi:2-methylisocitrate lyase-like PEP mutase family enzyme
MTATSQYEKAVQFRALHDAPGVFLIPNPWDAGSARILSALGFQALATSSYASAGVQGRLDGELTREEALIDISTIVRATHLPVSADLGRGFGDEPPSVAKTIQLVADVGVVGASIEDATGDAGTPLYDLALSTVRVAAAVEAAKALPFPFVVTARAENFVSGVPDLEDTIRRLRAYERAGADVLFAPGLPDLSAVEAVCAAVSKPVNFMAGIRGRSFTVAELSQAGVKRISFGASLFRAAMTGLLETAREVLTRGTFSYTEDAMTSEEWRRLLGR